MRIFNLLMYSDVYYQKQVQTNDQEIFETKNMYTISIIIPTYNE